ncbi:MAG: hypothetical protein GYB67_00060 [Chloroflexi bacterium]|nr:hypothetical protein [Chloroflexota bacterium]
MLVELSEPSIAAVFGRDAYLPANRVAVQVQRLRIARQQERLLAHVTAQFDAQVIGRTDFVINNVSLVVEAAAVDVIRAFPGVQTVVRSRPMFLDSPRPTSPGTPGLP